MSRPLEDQPPLVLVFTTREEIGLEGTKAFAGVVPAAARVLINLDGGDSGKIEIGCAGSAEVRLRRPVAAGEPAAARLTFKIEKLRGGHSGLMIHDATRANALLLLAAALPDLLATGPSVRVLRLDGGEGATAIPESASAVLAADEADVPALRAVVDRVREDLKRAWPAETDIVVTLDDTPGPTAASLPQDTVEAFLAAARTLPHGVTEADPAKEAVPVSSANFATVHAPAEEGLGIVVSLRAMRDDKTHAAMDRVAAAARSLGFETTSVFKFPAWTPRETNPLADRAAREYRRLFGEELVVETVHAGLEVGVMLERIGRPLHAIALGPTMEGIHTVYECVSISGIEKTWSLLCALLREAEAMPSVD
jgi:dipeptidase D